MGFHYTCLYQLIFNNLFPCWINDVFIGGAWEKEKKINIFVWEIGKSEKVGMLQSPTASHHSILINQLAMNLFFDLQFFSKANKIEKGK